MQPDPVRSANAKRREPAFMLEASKVALDRSAAALQPSEAPRLTRDERVQAVGTVSTATREPRT